jgi:hypothetical protein
MLLPTRLGEDRKLISLFHHRESVRQINLRAVCKFYNTYAGHYTQNISSVRL